MKRLLSALLLFLPLGLLAQGLPPFAPLSISPIPSAAGGGGSGPYGPSSFTNNAVLIGGGTGNIQATGIFGTSTGNALTALNSITSVAALPLVLATGTFGTAITFASATGIPTFATGAVFGGGLSGITSLAATSATIAGSGTGINFAVSQSGSVNGAIATFFAPLVSTGNAVGFHLGASDTGSYNAAYFQFTNAGGTGSSSNNFSIGMNGVGPCVTMTTTLVTFPGLGLFSGTTDQSGQGTGNAFAGGVSIAKSLLVGTSITTGSPSSGTAAAWNLGSYVSTPPTGTSGYAQIAIAGSAYQVPVGPTTLVRTYGRVTAQVAANASIATYTVGASDGSFEVSGNVLVTASVTNSFTETCAYTDESNTPRTLTLTFSNVGGTFLTTITNVTGTGAYEGVPLQIRAKAATTITFATVGTFTSVTYNAEGSVRQLN